MPADAGITGTLRLDRAATVLTFLVLSGHGRLYGAFIGALVKSWWAHFLSKILAALDPGAGVRAASAPIPSAWPG